MANVVEQLPLLSKSFLEISTRFEKIERRFHDIDKKIVNIDGKYIDIDRRMEYIEKRDNGKEQTRKSIQSSDQKSTSAAFLASREESVTSSSRHEQMSARTFEYEIEHEEDHLELKQITESTTVQKGQLSI